MIVSLINWNQTVYLIEHAINCGFEDAFDLEFKTSFGEYQYENIQGIKYGDKDIVYTLLLIEFDDSKGIKSLSFTPKIPEAPYQFSCPKMQLFNLMTGRSYEFSKVITTNDYDLIKPTPNLLKLYFENPKLTGQVEGKDSIIQVTFIGTIGQSKHYLKSIRFSQYQLSSQEDIGDIIGVSFKFITNIESFNDFKNFKISFDSIRLIQSCPDDSHSSCIPKKVNFVSDQGLLKTFEFWKRSQADKLELIFGNNWFPLTQIGK